MRERKKERGGRGEEAPCSSRCSRFLSVFPYPQCHDFLARLPYHSEQAASASRTASEEELRKSKERVTNMGTALETVDKHSNLVLLLLRWRSARLKHPLRNRDWVSRLNVKE
jgi:hypothetical protein